MSDQDFEDKGSIIPRATEKIVSKVEGNPSKKPIVIILLSETCASQALLSINVRVKSILPILQL
jgi:hypothetical protein